MVTVIGPNGAGKSTLLAALMGVLPARGALRFAGEDIARLSLEQRVMRGIALVPEKRELFGTMAVEDNLVLGAYRQMRLSNRGWRGELRPRLCAVPAPARTPHAAGRHAQSGGERQMLALGRALMSQPRLLMLDEPSLGLAPLVVQEIFRTIEQLRQTGVTILLVEQNARAALAVADHGYVLETGEVVLQGPARELAGDARIVETYLGASGKTSNGTQGA